MRGRISGGVFANLLGGGKSEISPEREMGRKRASTRRGDSEHTGGRKIKVSGVFEKNAGGRGLGRDLQC